MSLLDCAKRLVKKLVRPLSRPEEKASGLEYWKQRAEQYGSRAVFNIGHSESEMESVTHMQKQVLFPLLRERLRGDERLLLDFGCGPGRFTPDLAAMIGGRAIGVDPVERFIAMAPRGGGAEYRLALNGAIPLGTGEADVVWICLVLGVIVDPAILQKTAFELSLVLKQDGLLFLVENTADKPSFDRFQFRSVQEYQTLFPDIALERVSEYTDLGEQITIMAGRRHG